jgi:hypothetical protein
MEKWASLAVQIGIFVCSAWAFLFVIWPAIRQQQRMGRKLEELLDSEEVRGTIRYWTGYSPAGKEKS